MSLSSLCIERPIGTTLCSLGIALASLLAYTQLPVAALPEVESPTMVVATALPGASAETMVNTVTTPLERQLGQIPGLQQMSSVSGFGSSQVTLEFGVAHDLGAAEQDVLAAINAATNLLPSDLPAPPTFSKSNPADVPVLTLAVRGEHVPRAVVDDFADSILAQRLSQVTGVGLVSLGGGQKPAMRIAVDAAALAAAGLTLADVRQAIVTHNVNAPKGSLDGPRQAFALSVDDQLLQVSQFENLVLAYQNGAPLLLSQVARVRRGLENEQLAGWANGSAATIVNVQRQPGENLLAISRGVRALLPQLEAMAPPGVTLEILSDRTGTIQAALDDVEWTLLLTVALVTAVMYVFLQNGRATLLPMVVVPLSLVTTFGVMWALGYSLDNLSLMALTIAVGFVVDDAIVMVENIARYLEQGLGPIEAARRGASEIAFTILSLTGSLVAVLIPLLFMGGVVGRLFREFAVTLATAISVSAAWSLTITPMLASLWLHTQRPHRRGIARLCERALHGLGAGYAASLTVVLRHRRLTLLVWLSCVGLTAALAWRLPKGFFPQQDTGLVVMVTQGAADASFAQMQRQQERLAARLQSDPDVASVASFVGSDAVNMSPTRGRLSVALVDKSARQSPLKATMARLLAAAAEAGSLSVSLQPVQDLQLDNRASRTQYQYSLSGPDSASLAAFERQVVAALAPLPSLRDVTSEHGQQSPTLALRLDRDVAARLGVAPQAIDDTLYDAFGQRIVSTLFTQLNQYRVILGVAEDGVAGPAALSQLWVQGNAGPVPLSQVVSPQHTETPWLIAHQGQFPAMTVSFNLAEGASLGDAMADIEGTVAKLGVPSGMTTSFVGAAAAFSASLQSEPQLIATALLVVYLVLGLLYESYVHPLTILSTLPSAGLGALYALWALGYDLDVLGLIGLVLLIGIVKKNGILMVDFALAAEREQGCPPGEAIYQACVLRFRPILMTTLAAVLGGLPLALGRGVGAELRQPLGVAMVGGLVVSQLLTLYTTPVIYLAMDAVVRRLRAGLDAGTPQPVGSSDA